MGNGTIPKLNINIGGISVDKLFFPQMKLCLLDLKIEYHKFKLINKKTNITLWLKSIFCNPFRRIVIYSYSNLDLFEYLLKIQTHTNICLVLSVETVAPELSWSRCILINWFSPFEEKGNIRRHTSMEEQYVFGHLTNAYCFCSNLTRIENCKVCLGRFPKIFADI